MNKNGFRFSAFLYCGSETHKEKRVIVLEIKEPSVPENNGFKLSLNGRRIKKRKIKLLFPSHYVWRRGGGSAALAN